MVSQELYVQDTSDANDSGADNITVNNNLINRELSGFDVRYKGNYYRGKFIKDKCDFVLVSTMDKSGSDWN